MTHILGLVLVVLLLIIFFILMAKGIHHMCEHTTTTSVDSFDQYDVVGNLKRGWEGGQPYVIDPVDGSKTWVNTKDDMYEDAADKIWRLT